MAGIQGVVPHIHGRNSATSDVCMYVYMYARMYVIMLGLWKRHLETKEAQ